MRDCRTPWRLYVGISSWPKSNSLGDVSGSTYYFHAFRSGSLEVQSVPISERTLNICENTTFTFII
jgi:hypothetical protein